MKQAMIDYVKKPKFDHFDTPDYAVYPLLRYLDPAWMVWEPTDTTGKSRIAAVLRKHGNMVISTGQGKADFLKDDPGFRFDCIITNPPYSIKDDFIFRAMALRTPFAFLLPLTALEGVRRSSMFRDMGKKFGVLVLDRRVEFTGGSVWFNTSWFCYGILPQQLIFAELEKEKEADETRGWEDGPENRIGAWCRNPDCRNLDTLGNGRKAVDICLSRRKCRKPGRRKDAERKGGTK
jgi:hypothetical protein